MSAGKLDLTIEQGATFEHILIWKDTDEVVINLTDYDARMQIRTAVDSNSVIHELTVTNSGITITGTEGKITLQISATKTASFNWTEAVYDLELISSGGIVTRLVEGRVFLNKEVTH